jgi:hypothetical protein
MYFRVCVCLLILLSSVDLLSFLSVTVSFSKSLKTFSVRCVRGVARLVPCTQLTRQNFMTRGCVQECKPLRQIH